MKKMGKKITGTLLLICFISSLYGGTIQATQSQIDEVKENIDELEEKRKRHSSRQSRFLIRQTV